MRQRQQLDDVTHVVGGFQIKRGDVADALGEHVVDLHAAVERDGGQDGDLRRRIEAVDVGGGVGLGEALRLRLGERVVVGHVVLDHAREHVVGGAVDDAHDRGDLVGDERVLQRVDDGDAAADRRLEGDLAVRLARGAHDLLAVGGHDGLVRRDDVLAGRKRAQDDLARRRGAADELDHDVDLGVGHHLVPVGGEDAAEPAGLGLLGAARAYAHDLQVDPEMAREVLAVLLQDVDTPAADGAGADEP